METTVYLKIIDRYEAVHVPTAAPTLSLSSGSEVLNRRVSRQKLCGRKLGPYGRRRVARPVSIGRRRVGAKKNMLCYNQQPRIGIIFCSDTRMLNNWRSRSLVWGRLVARRFFILKFKISLPGTPGWRDFSDASYCQGTVGRGENPKKNAIQPVHFDSYANFRYWIF